LAVIARSVSDEANQRPWVYPCGARKLGKNITAAPLVAARDDELYDL